MILGIDKILELIRTKNLVEDLDEKNMNFEGCGVDLRLGEVYEMSDEKGFLHIETRKTPKYKLIGKFEKNKKSKIKLEPGKIYAATTVEKINTPDNLFGWFIPRQTLYKCGIVVQGIRTDPGYHGNFSFVMINISKKAFELEMGARIANMVFHKVDGKTKLYKGQWQNGRAFIEKTEKQVKQNAEID